METKTVKGTFEISESNLESLVASVNDLGGQIFVEKALKFEDLGLVEIEKNQVQCLACSHIFNGNYARYNAAKHFKKSHTDTNPRETQKMECPRCNEEVSKSNMNVHMDQKHGVKKFDQLLKRSYPGTSGIPPKKAAKTKLEKPPKKAAKTKLERDPLASTSVDFNNNKVKIEKDLALSTDDFNNNKVKIEKSE